MGRLAPEEDTHHLLVNPLMYLWLYDRDNDNWNSIKTLRMMWGGLEHEILESSVQRSVE